MNIKVELRETLEEVKEEEMMEDVGNLSAAVEEEENHSSWAVEERERRMALDYYVDMAFNGGVVPKNSDVRKRKRKNEAEEEAGGKEHRERNPRKPRKPRAPRKPRDRLGKN